MAFPSADTERDLLGEALGIAPRDLTPLSREPLGAGDVAGFSIAGEPPRVGYIDSSQLAVAAETGLVLPGVARVWVHPADPHLPALAPAAYGDGVSTLLRRLGIAATGAPVLVGYRPGRRGVLRVPTRDGHVWVKVVRPRRIDRVVQAHAGLRNAGLPVPMVRGWSPEGLLVLDEADGVAVTAAPWQPADLLDAVDEVRARLARVPLAWPARVGMPERLPWYAEQLRRLAAPPRSAQGEPRAGDPLGEGDDLVARIGSALGSGADDAITSTVHGDLHIGQLFVDESGAVTGLIDVDTAGQGHPADDAAAFIAHAVASALLTPRDDRARVWALADLALLRWAGTRTTRARIAAQLVGHALGAADSPARRGLLLTVADDVMRDGVIPKKALMRGFGSA